MRKKKEKNNTAMSALITAPVAFIEYAKANMGCSKLFQTAVAESLLGFTCEEFVDAVSKYEDTRYTKEPREKEYLRIAKWILEGEPVGALGDNREFLVHWKKSDTYSVVRLYKKPVFERVTYSLEVYSHEEIMEQVNCTEGVSTPEEIWCNPVRVYGLGRFNQRVIIAWFKHWGFDVTQYPGHQVDVLGKYNDNFTFTKEAK